MEDKDFKKMNAISRKAWCRDLQALAVRIR